MPSDWLIANCTSAELMRPSPFRSHALTVVGGGAGGGVGGGVEEDTVNVVRGTIAHFGLLLSAALDIAVVLIQFHAVAPFGWLATNASANPASNAPEQLPSPLGSIAQLY